MLYDFHTHSILSDGVLSPVELIRRASHQGYKAIAITDHVGPGSLARIIQEVSTDCALANSQGNILAIPGVELTHLPPSAIAETAKKAKALGAKLVIVHGESPVEPVPRGTNLAALSCPYVDILAHPGFLTLEEAKLASTQGIFLELTARRGHSLCNGYIARLAEQAGARLLVGSDAHEETELLNKKMAFTILRGAGLAIARCRQILTLSPQSLLQKLSLPSP